MVPQPYYGKTVGFKEKEFKTLLPIWYQLSPNIRKVENVQKALIDNKWINDIKDTLTIGIFADFLDLSESLITANLLSECDDKTHL
jgi:hypothetical protein